MLIGRLGKDPEMRYLPSGEAVTNFSLATSETWKDKTTGDKKESTEWHNIAMFSRLAEIAGQYLKKGKLVYIEGRLKTRKWQTKEGHDRYTTEIVANEMKMLGSRSDEEASGSIDSSSSREDMDRGGDPLAGARPAHKPAGRSANKLDDVPDDIPF